ncbi:MAG: hypothetical protein WC716_11945 [Chitinophagaceae bacterium]|jgi:hypothetical protein
MKKVLFSVLAITFTAGTQAFAQDQVTPVIANASPVATINAEVPQAAATPQDNKSQIAAENLPEAVKKTLASEKYKDWTVASAWLVKGKTEYYELQMKKGEETTSLKFDANGNVIS